MSRLGGLYGALLPLYGPWDLSFSGGVGRDGGSYLGVMWLCLGVDYCGYFIVWSCWNTIDFLQNTLKSTPIKPAVGVFCELFAFFSSDTQMGDDITWDFLQNTHNYLHPITFPNMWVMECLLCVPNLTYDVMIHFMTRVLLLSQMDDHTVE